MPKTRLFRPPVSVELRVNTDTGLVPALAWRRAGKKRICPEVSINSPGNPENLAIGELC